MRGNNSMNFMQNQLVTMQEEQVKPSPKKQKLNTSAKAAAKAATPEKKAATEKANKPARGSASKKGATPRKSAKSKAGAKAGARTSRNKQRISSDSEEEASSGSDFKAEEVDITLVSSVMENTWYLLGKL